LAQDTTAERQKELKTPPEKQEKVKELSEQDKFEQANKHLGLYYNKPIFGSILRLFDEILMELRE